MPASGKSITLAVGSHNCFPTVCLLSKRSRQLIGAGLDDIIRIQSQDGRWVITRRVVETVKMEKMDDYVFLSEDDLELLGVQYDDHVDVSFVGDLVECP